MSRFRHIDTSGLPEGYDIADLVASGVTGADLKGWCKQRIKPGPPTLTASEKKSLATKERRAAGPAPERHETPAPQSNVVPLPEPELNNDGVPIEFSEDSLANEFTSRHHYTMAYVGPWKSWMHWNGSVWELDESGYALDLARGICREKAKSADERLELANKRKVIANILSARKTISAVEQIARTDRRHVVKPSQFDADPWSLNTPDGILSLKTGRMRKPEREDWCSKRTAVAPSKRAGCPRWLEFLKVAMQGDEDLISYLQRVAGYCLTGSVAEHVFFFCYGTGGNGKGTFLNLLYWLFADYSIQANMDTFTEQRFARHAAEIAVFQGARLVAASETESGQRWNESRIKQMTGGDPLTANFMRQNPFTFIPTFKLMFAGNHKPHLRNVDPAIKRRLYLIPFDFEVPPAKRDPALPEKLKEEGPGILYWALQGCLEWQQNSLDPPAPVIATTREYFEQEDKIGTFLDDCCVRGPKMFTGSTRLYERYVRWADNAGEYAGTRRDFLQLMALKGYISVKKNGAQIFQGIGILDEGGDQPTVTVP